MHKLLVKLPASLPADPSGYQSANPSFIESASRSGLVDAMFGGHGGGREEAIIAELSIMIDDKS